MIVRFSYKNEIKLFQSLGNGINANNEFLEILEELNNLETDYFFKNNHSPIKKIKKIYVFNIEFYPIIINNLGNCVKGIEIGKVTAIKRKDVDDCIENSDIEDTINM